ncbi:hypothetical protein ABZ890_11895 [Streptomyces sp. NPDC046984]|uniref:hypothetical protein n=1 Tax=Streptomyces sp. NPDC046984 TaxID=3155138 RepID=UPI0033FA6591
MTFPQTPLDVRIDLQINGIWTDITSDVYTAEKITITRGRADEAARVDPGKCALTLNNRLGKYSPRNPLSPYFGQIGRNTPIRVSVLSGSAYLATSGSTSTDVGATTPDASALDITGDLDVRFEAALQNWTTSGSVELCGKGLQSTNQQSWVLMMRLGRLHLEWSTAGTSTLFADSTALLPGWSGRRLAVRATLDVNNGASGSTVTFYYADHIAGPWTQLGNPVVTAGTTSIFNSSAPVTVGNGWTDIGFPSPNGQVYAFELRAGIDGTVVANPNFTAQAPGTTSFTDAAGRTWTVLPMSSLTNRRTRFVGEVSSWPSRWDVSGKDVRVPIEAAGILRRLGQGSSPVQSTMRREFSNPARTGIVAYWPCEDGSAATSVASGLPGGTPMRIVKSGVSFAASDTWPASDVLPTMQTGTIRGQIPAYASTGEIAVRLFMQLPDGGLQAAAQLYSLGTTGSIRTWEVWADPSAQLRIRALDSEGIQLYDSGYLDMSTTNQGGPAVVNGARISLNLALVQDGSSVDWNLTGINIDESTLMLGPLKSFALSVTGTLGVAQQISINETANLGDTVVGHVAIANATSAYTSTLAALVAQAGETAVDRITRLRTENQLNLVIERGNAPSALMGPQSVDTLLNLLEEAADVDGGILYELRDDIGLIYRDRQSLYNQTPALLLDYNTKGHVAPPLEPVDDDQKVRNNVTVTRSGGSSGQAVLEVGPLSIQDPPNGVGVYDDSVTLNVYSDDQAAQHAGWRLHLGTVDEARYPVINIDLAAAPDLIDQVTDMDSGDRVQIAHPPAWLPPNTIDQLTQGYTEVIGHPIDWDVSLNCTPASPWTVAVAGDPVLGKADTEGTKLTSALTSTDTVALVTTTSGPVWTSSLAQTPFDWEVGGETVRVVAPGPMTNGNPFFDAGIGSWSGTNATITPDTTLPRPHPSALGLVKVTPSGGTFSVLAGNTLGPGTAGPNGRYQLSAWVYSPNGWASGLQLQANWFNSSGTYLTTTGGTITAIPAGTWTPLLDVVVAPAGADRAQVLIRQNGTPAGSDVYYAWAVQISRISASAVYDEFGRSVTGSWGAADSLQTWTLISGGTGADYSVTSGYGRHINTAVSAAHHSLIASPSDDFDIYCDIAVAALSTGASQFAGVLARYVDGNNLYESRVEFTTGNAINLSIRKRVTSTETQLGTFASSLTNAAGAFVRVRFQGAGASLRARIWAPGGEEPTAWHVDVTDSALSAAGSIGVKSVRNAGNTNTNAESRFDNFALINPQQFTVARSLNGIVKAQSSGTDVRLVQPAVAAL